MMKATTPFSLTTLPKMDGRPAIFGTNNTSFYSSNWIYGSGIILLIISVLGFVGNGIIIWILGFCIKSNPFNTYILNLAAADFGILVTIALSFTTHFIILAPELGKLIIRELSLFVYSSDQLLLTAISIDRCLAVLFSIWHRCRRPPHLTITVCALIWVFSFLLNGIHFTLSVTGSLQKPSYLRYYQFMVNALICLPIMTVSTAILFIKLCFKSRQLPWKKPFTVSLLTLLVFLVFAFPLNALYFLDKSFKCTHHRLHIYGAIGSSLNSSINPIIYFLVGREKRDQCWRNLKSALKRLFQEEEISRGELPDQTQL